MTRRLYFFLSLLILGISPAFAQEHMAKISGKIIDENRQAIPLVNISIEGKAGGTSSDNHGNYSMDIPSNTSLTLIFSFIGFESEKRTLKMKSGQQKVINISLLQSAKMLSDVVVEDKEVRKTTLTRIDPQSALVIPTASGGIEALVTTRRIKHY